MAYRPPFALAFRVQRRLARTRRLRLEVLDNRCLPSTFTVNSASDVSGTGLVTLRDAINMANLHPGPDTIEFAIATDNSVQTIQPMSPLPAITDAVLIDGYSEPGASPNTLTAGDNARILIRLDGSVAGIADGLDITGGGSTVRGLAITG